LLCTKRLGWFLLYRYAIVEHQPCYDPGAVGARRRLHDDGAALAMHRRTA